MDTINVIDLMIMTFTIMWLHDNVDDNDNDNDDDDDEMNDDENDGNDDEVDNNDINHLVLHLYNLA